MAKFDKHTRLNVLKKTNYKCAMCGKELNLLDMTIDHFIPQSKGGTSQFKNLIPLCQECNLDKSNIVLDPEEAYENLSYKYINELYILYRKYFETEAAKVRRNIEKFIIVQNNAVITIEFDYKKHFNRDYYTFDLRKENNSSKFKGGECRRSCSGLTFDMAYLEYDKPIILENDKCVVYVKSFDGKPIPYSLICGTYNNKFNGVARYNETQK